MKILTLAGGYDQIALIEELKARGHQVLLADYLENPVAKPYADYHHRISTLDEEAVFSLAKREKVDLVTTACTDQALLTAANVSERLGLPFYLSSRKALEITDKRYMKDKMAANGIPTAKYVVFEDRGTWKSHIEEAGRFPLVVKPCDCNSSKGVTRVNTEKELADGVERAFDLSRSGKVIAEEFVEGEEISIDAWIDGEGEKILSVTGTSKMRENADGFTIYQSKYPFRGMEGIRGQLEAIVKKIAATFELSHCPLLVQALVRGDEVSVIEFSARMGGGTKYKLIEYVSGIPIMEKYVDRILGDSAQVLHPTWSEKKMELNYVYAYNGTVTKVTGLEELKEQGFIKEFFQYQSVGSVIRKRTTSSDRVFGFLLAEEDEETLRKTRKYVLDRVDVLDGDRSILYKGCFQ